jgi:hypothetical protein
VKPTRIQYFYANDWPTKIWKTSIPIGSFIIAFIACDPTLDVLSDWRNFVYLLIILTTSVFLGRFIAILLGWFILGPLLYSRMVDNGGPFKIGDSVQILTGPYRGKISTVYSTWQGDSVRVSIGEEAKEDFSDVFYPEELLKEK